MNSTLFFWPLNIKKMLDVANTRLTNLRDAAEDALRARIDALEKSIASSGDYVHQMQKKEALSQDEMKRANATLDEFLAQVNAFNEEAEAISRCA